MAFGFRNLCIGLFCTTLFFSTLALSPARASPEAFVTSLSAQILAAAKTRNTAQFHALLRRYADIRGIADFALGRWRSKLPASQRSTYYQLAEQDMVKFFGEYSGSLRGSTVTVLRVTRTGGLIHVETTINGGGGRVSWRLIQAGGYRVRDVQVAGIWLGHLMRSEYGNILRRDGYQKLFAYLRQ